MTEKLLVVDGHSIAYRAFYALPSENFQTTTGQYTNAIYGFTTMFARLLDIEKPTRVAVAFDLSRHSFRTDEYPEYKGTREQAPLEFNGQVDLIKEILNVMSVPVVVKENYEADDILATFSTQADTLGWETLVASGDRDTFQLISDQVTVLYPGQRGGEMRRMTPIAIEERYGVSPKRYPEIAALVGESSDNLPGIPGVGPKVAAQWINTYDGLDNLLARADEISGKRGQALRDHVESVRQNRKLNRLVTDLDLGVTVEDLYRGETDHSELFQLFDTLEFTGLRDRVLAVENIAQGPGAGGSKDPMLEHHGSEGGSSDLQTKVTVDTGKNTEVPASSPPRVEYGSAVDVGALDILLVDEKTSLQSWLDTLEDSGVGVWVSGDPDPCLPDVRFVIMAQGSRVAIVDSRDATNDQIDALRAYIDSAENLVVHDAKALRHCIKAIGIIEVPLCFDVALAAYLLHPEQRSYALPELSQRILGIDLNSPVHDDALFEYDAAGPDSSTGSPDEGRGKRQLTESMKAAAQQAAVLVMLKDALVNKMNMDEYALLTDLEQPLSRVLGVMEDRGIAVDGDELAAQHQELVADVNRCAQEAYDAIGHQVNLSSPKQLQEVLFNELGLPKTKKTKTGYTTNAEALAGLYARTASPFVGALIKHRDRIKLLQMIETLQGSVRDDGRIHTVFSQTATVTGRLASSDPNLQNIPARTPDGLRVRKGFIAASPWETLMSVDYSQIEMRIMAHLSNDQGLIDAFNSGEDLHKTVASMVFGTPVDEVTPEERTRIKATSFGLAYGLSSYGLAAQLGVSVPEAAALREKYFERFGGVHDYLESLVKQARQDGYTQTMFGRRRYLPDLTSTNRQRREMAERAALNAPIQGSAADIIKLAMNRVEKDLQDAQMGSRLLLQIHDELIFEVAPQEREELEGRVVYRMEMPPIPESMRHEKDVEHAQTDAGHLLLRVPLSVAVGVGHSWMEAAH